MSAPDSWKRKCSIRRVDDVAMTDHGTLILRRAALPPMRPPTETQRFQSPSLAPFAIDVPDEEDHLPPARNRDALGLRLQTMDVDPAGSTTRGAFLAGLSAGLTVIAVAGALAFASFTSDYASHVAGRSPSVVAQGHSTLAVAEPETAILKAPPARRRVTRAHFSVETAPAEIPVEMLPDASESE